MARELRDSNASVAVVMMHLQSSNAVAVETRSAFQNWAIQTSSEALLYETS